MRRVVIVGTSGSGKSTLAAELAPILNADLIDLDTIIWGPDWTLRPDSDVRRLLAPKLAGDRWVLAGNRRKTRDLIWGAADTLVWLDYPLSLALWRLWWRTWRRVLTREELWNGNRERFSEQFLSRNSLLLYAIQTHNQKRRLVQSDLRDPVYAHLTVHRFTTPGATEHWLAQLQETIG